MSCFSHWISEQIYLFLACCMNGCASVTGHWLSGERMWLAEGRCATHALCILDSINTLWIDVTAEPQVVVIMLKHYHKHWLGLSINPTQCFFPLLCLIFQKWIWSVWTQWPLPGTVVHSNWVHHFQSFAVYFYKFVFHANALYNHLVGFSPALVSIKFYFSYWSISFKVIINCIS